MVSSKIDSHVLFIGSNVIYHHGITSNIGKFVSLSSSDKEVVGEIVQTKYLFDINKEFSRVEEDVIVDMDIGNLLDVRTEATAPMNN